MYQEVSLLRIELWYFTQSEAIHGGPGDERRNQLQSKTSRKQADTKPILPHIFLPLRMIGEYIKRAEGDRDAPDFVEVGEAGIAVDDAMRRQHRVQLVAWRTWNDELQAQL
jgi:hypothetical protein